MKPTRTHNAAEDVLKIYTNDVGFSKLIKE